MSEVTKDEKLEIAFERVEKVDSPLLVIGLGGTGIGILREIKKVFRSRYQLDQGSDGTTLDRPKRTAYLAIDTDDNESTGFSKDEFVHLHVDGLGALLKNGAALQPYETAWLDPEFSTIKSGPGAGSIRQASRFCLSRCYSSVYNSINSAIKRILTSDKIAVVPGRLEVVICAGISGGTGSGIFLDIPQIVRHVQRNSPYTPNITGYLVLPDATLAISNVAPNLHASFQANAYAALKELDFWQRFDEHHTQYTIQYNTTPEGKIEWSHTPYDACILLSAYDANGKLIDNCEEELQKTVAENLLHYLANETVSNQDEQCKPQYSYISHENNLVHLLKDQKMETTTPLYHGYRAIGAYSMAIPKRKMFAYEASLLFMTFMPDVSQVDGTLIVNTARLDRNELPEAVHNLLPTMKDRLEKFKGAMLPDFCHTSTKDDSAIRALQEASVKPHDRADVHQWRSSKVYGEANSAARKYLEEAWANFVNFAKSVIENPKEGPFSLERYLTDKSERGFMPLLNNAVADYRQRYKKAQNDVVNAQKNCVSAYDTFVHPPFLSKQKSIAAYMTSINQYYSGIITEKFFENHVTALDMLIKRIENFIQLALAPMNEDLLAMREEFSTRMTSDAASDLVGMDIMKNRIDTVFSGANAEFAITNTYLTALGKMVTATIENQDPKAAYVTFSYQAAAADLDNYSLVRDTLQDCFRFVFTDKLDDLMRQAVGDDPQALDDLIIKKVDHLKSAATPLFSDLNILSEPQVPFIYLSVPENSEAFVNYTSKHQSDANFTPKKSSITDRIYCLLTWDGMPLSRYSQIAVLEAAYNARVHIADVSGGLHLVRTRTNVNPGVSNDWSLLPSPAPYYFFGSAPADTTIEKRFKKTIALVNRAVKCGMMTIDNTVPHPVYTVRLFYTDNVNGILRSPEALKKDINEIPNLSLNPATGVAYTEEEKLAKLTDILAGATEKRLQASCSIAVMHSFCGFGPTDLIDPFNPAVRQNADSLAIAQANFEKLSLSFGAALVASDPYLEEKMNAQLEVFEAYDAAYNGIKRGSLVWEGRAAYASIFCRMLIHDVLFHIGAGFGYVNAAKTKSYLYEQNSPWMADDLKDEDCELLKACSYLAERPETDQTRQYLEFVLKRRESDFSDGEMNGTLTADDYNDLIENAQSLLEEIDEYLAEKNVALTSFSANVGLLNKQIAMLENMKKITAKQISTCKHAMKHL